MQQCLDGDKLSTHLITSPESPSFCMYMVFLENALKGQLETDKWLFWSTKPYMEP
jgi:hypothetical protein